MLTSHANRGRGLEHAVRLLFKSYRSHEIWCQQNHPATTSTGIITERHGFDFEILYQGKFMAFDAKECAAARWPLDKAKPHQLKAMLDVIANGGTGFFLVLFTGSKRLVKFDATLIQSAIAGGKKSLSPDDGEPTTINLLGVK